MRVIHAGVALGLVLLPAFALAQSPKITMSVPRVVNISGEFPAAGSGTPLPFETVTISIYAQESGGAPLWQETQTVAVDAAGFYSVLLGATQPDGIPVDIFGSGEARWIALSWDRAGQAQEVARTRLTSVPYALRALDAETLGGLPASAYLRAPGTGQGSGVNRVAVAAGTPGADGAEGTTTVVETSTGATPKAVNVGTPNYVAKYVTSTDVGNSAIYELNGMVGFNTTTPADIIHSRFTNTDGTLTGLAVQNLATGANSYSGMLFYDNAGAVAQFQGFNNSTHEYRINNIATGAKINFMTGGVSRLLANSVGQVGINNASPAVTFDVARDGFYSDAHFMTYMNTAAGTYLDAGVARGTVAAPLAVQAGDILASHGAWGHMGAAFGWARPAYMDFRAAEAFTNTANGTDITFANTLAGSNLNTTRMIIHNSGNVGIGNGNTAPLDKLQVVGDIRVGTSGTNGCIKNFAGTGIAGTCSSDARLKEDIRGFDPVLDRVAALRPVHFTWRAEEFPERHYGKDRAYGLIAQEVEKVLPEMVVTQGDGMKAVDYSELPLLTIQAIKELKQRVAELQAEVEQLRKK